MTWILVVLLLNGQRVELASHTDAAACHKAAVRVSATKPAHCEARRT